MNLLMAEDDPIARAVLAASVRQLGHDVTIVADGVEAWQSFSVQPAKVVVSDWSMPGLDGLELCRRIRARGGDYTYFILISDRDATGGNLEQAVEAGVDDFLSKPVNAPELWSRLRVADRILNYATQVRQLQEFIPICGYCRKIRDDQNYWNQVEDYLSKQSGVNLSHGVCPDCYETVMAPQMRRLGAEPPPYPEVRRVVR
jgi:CheY-like chemotaxis protein